MSDLEVSHGGVVAVDTAQLWTAAAVMAHQARRLQEIATDVSGVQHALWQLGGAAGWDVLECARRAVQQAERVTEGLGWLGQKLARTAEEYEETELRARWVLARLQGDEDARVLLAARARELGLDAAALDEEPSMFGPRAAAWWQMASQYALPLMGSPLGGVGAGTAGVLIFGLLAFIQHLDRGTFSPGAPLSGPVKPVVVQVLAAGGIASVGATGARAPTSGQAVGGPGTAAGPGARLHPSATVHPGTTANPGATAGSRLHTATTPTTAPRPGTPHGSIAPPASLAALARRIPNSAAQVSIERFTMPGGRTEWGVYIAGTRSAAMGGSEPWDMTSNTELYFGERSASSEAVFEAMRAAGVSPEEPVHLVGHSQGGMIAAGVATSGDYSVGSLTTFGSPVDAVVPDSVLSVRVRHDDDPVAALAGVGNAAGSGSADSVVVSRTGNPRPGLHDLSIPTHGLDEYARTAELYQASGDSRVRAVEQLFARLGEAQSVTRTEYVAVRTQ